MIRRTGSLKTKSNTTKHQTMQFDSLIPVHSPLANLLQRARYWQQLDTATKRLLPANLHPHFRIACIEEGALIIHVSAPMAATRLKMLLPNLLPQLQELDPSIARIQIKTRPHNPEAPKSKNFHLSERALNSFAQTAQKVAHHPKLATALQNLVKNNRNANNN